MVITRSQAGPPRGGLVASPGANPPSAVSNTYRSQNQHNMVLRSRQGNAGVIIGSDDGSASTIVACGGGTHSNFKVEKT